MTEKEIALVRKMLYKNEENLKFFKLLGDICVTDLDDGRMGGILFESANENRKLGREVASLKFKDLDGIDVLVTLSLDNYGDLYELDIWKVDFSPLMNFPYS